MSRDRAREVGKATFDSVRGGLRRRLASLLTSDPGVLDRAIELGLVRREWVENPDGEAISSASPVEVLQRFLEREVERRPSMLKELGLSAVHILTSRDGEDTGTGVPTQCAVVFTDLEGFTTWTEKAGDEAASDLLQRLNLTVGPIVRGRGGSIVKRLGDGVLLTFSGPEAAVLAALELVNASPAPLKMRAGVHWGEVMATRDDVIGHAVNVAARVVDAARGGEVLTTEEARRAADGARGVSFGRVGRRKVKGLDEPVRVCRVVWTGSSSPLNEGD